jgi:hypothetical protein
MRAFLLICLLAAVLAEEYHDYHYYDGQLIVNQKVKSKVEGPIFVEYLKTINVTVLAGMHVEKKDHIPFAIATNMTNITIKGDNIEFYADCLEMYWGLKSYAGLKGGIYAKGTYKGNLELMGGCYSEKEKFGLNVSVKGVHVDCPFYLPPEASKRAEILVGEKAESFKNIHVLNFAIMGYPYIQTLDNCTFWLKTFNEVNVTKPGFVIVGKDGLHCAIIDKEGDKFIQTDPAKKKVVSTPITEKNLKTYFPKGHIFKEYKC